MRPRCMAALMPKGFNDFKQLVKKLQIFVDWCPPARVAERKIGNSADIE